MVENILTNINNSSYEDIQYFLTGTFRIKLLLSLYESDKTVKELKNNLDKTESNILHYLKDFEDKQIVEKYNDNYTLTSNGYLIIRHISRLFKNWNSINNNIDYIDEHVESNMPVDLIMNVDIWGDAELVTSSHLDYNRAIHIYKDLVINSKYLKVILPILSIYHLEAILRSLDENQGKLDLITSKFIVKRIRGSILGSLFSKLEKKGQINVCYTSSHTLLNKFLTCTENVASLFLFYENGNCDDSEMLIVKDKQKVKRLNNIIDYNKFNF